MFNIFLPSWIQIRILYPDLLTQLDPNLIQIRIQNTSETIRYLTYNRRKIIKIRLKAIQNRRHPKKFTVTRTLRKLSKATSPPRFLFWGRCRHFVLVSLLLISPCLQGTKLLTLMENTLTFGWLLGEKTENPAHPLLILQDEELVHQLTVRYKAASLGSRITGTVRIYFTDPEPMRKFWIGSKRIASQITIYVPVVYIGQYEVVLRGDFFGPKWHSLRSLPFQGPKKSRFLSHPLKCPLLWIVPPQNH
jgi:hypothetical protein